jgi:hypothetical protein
MTVPHRSPAIDRVLAALSAFGPWFLDAQDGVRVEIRGVVTCPLCAVAGLKGLMWWRATERLGLTDREAEAVVLASDGVGDDALRQAMLERCSLGAQSVLPL